MKQEIKRQEAKNSGPDTTHKLVPLALLENIRDQLRLLIDLQRNCQERAGLSDDPPSVANERLVLYDRFLPLLALSCEELETELSIKHPGGAPQNPHRPLAMKILADHYISCHKVLQPKILAKEVSARLPEGDAEPDATGKEAFSVRVARKEIQLFKWILNQPFEVVAPELR
jgi:hypothetical protein